MVSGFNTPANGPVTGSTVPTGDRRIVHEEERLAEGRPIDVPALELSGGGKLAHLVLVPAESFVQYQLWAQKMRPDSFVVTAGFSECAPGYIPTAEAAREGYHDHYSWIAFPECEKQMVNAIGQALGARQA